MTSFLRSMADFLEPAGMVWLILTALVLLKIRRRQWGPLILPGAAWLILTLTSATMLPHVLLAALESKWQPVDLAAVPECDAIVVLGGGLEPSHVEPAGLRLKGGADRLFAGLMLAKKGRGKAVVVGGGAFRMVNGTESEADATKQWMESWALSPVPVTSLGLCTDTHDEAVKVHALAVKHGWKRVALVTSAYHMTRAKAVFEAAGTPVVPVPCNYLSVTMRGHRVDWVEVPNATNMAQFEAWMHEVIGWWAYRVAGWI